MISTRLLKELKASHNIGNNGENVSMDGLVALTLIHLYIRLLAKFLLTHGLKMLSQDVGGSHPKPTLGGAAL